MEGDRGRRGRPAGSAATAIAELLLHRQIVVRRLAFRLPDGVAPARLIREAGSLARDFPQGLAMVSRSGLILMPRRIRSAQQSRRRGLHLGHPHPRTRRRPSWPCAGSCRRLWPMSAAPRRSATPGSACATAGRNRG